MERQWRIYCLACAISTLLVFKQLTLRLAGPSISPFDPGQGNTMTFTLTQVPTIPEPETYAMLLAGLGLIGFIARRRKQVS
jgi:hypothetical protein